MQEFPIISILIPTYNEEDTLERCLKSIFRQDYPKEKLDVIIIDNKSIDNTIEIAKKFPLRIIFNDVAKDSLVSKRIGFEHSKGSFYTWIDADMELGEKKWLQKMIRPLLEDKEIVASMGRFTIKGDETSLTKFLTLDSLNDDGYSSQEDPIYKFFTPSMFDVIVEKRSQYYIAEYREGNIPSQGLGIYRKAPVSKTLHLQGDKLMELDILVYLVRLGYKKFAYVPVETYHYFMKDIKELARKRLRNIKKNYIGQNFERAYTWFDLSKTQDIFKIVFWIIYANLILPELLVGIYKSIKFRTWIGLYQPLVSFVETNVILSGFVYYYSKIVFQRLRLADNIKNIFTVI